MKNKSAKTVSKGLELKNIHIDFSGFSLGKILKVVSENRAEWVNP